jgi:predicted enzyme related to lactoylglutathione lyase
MRHVSMFLALSLSLTLAGACGGSPPPAAAPPTPATSNPAAAVRTGLQIGLTTVYVDDQAKALRFYTEVLGFVTKDDVSNEGFRWITVTAAGDPDGTQLQLALDSDPAAKAFQQAKFKASEPAIMFYTDDVKADHDRIKARGGEFTMPPTDVTYATIAMLKDTCGNLIQITQLER